MLGLTYFTTPAKQLFTQVPQNPGTFSVVHYQLTTCKKNEENNKLFVCG